MRIAMISIFFTIISITFLLVYLIPIASPNSFSLFVSQKFISELEESKIVNLKSITGTNSEGEKIEIPLDFSHDEVINVGIFDTLKGKVSFLLRVFSHSSTCTKRSDLEPHEPILTCTSGGWYTSYSGGQPWKHCHCYTPWGNP